MLFMKSMWFLCVCICFYVCLYMFLCVCLCVFFLCFHVCIYVFFCLFMGFQQLVANGGSAGVTGPAATTQAGSPIGSSVSDGLSQAEILRRIQQSRTLQQQTNLYKNSVRFMPY